MKPNFQRFVQEGHLINFSFESEPIRSVFDEILSLLSKQDSRLNAIEAQLSTFACKTDLENMKKESEKAKEEINAKISDFQSSNNKRIDDLQEWAENANSAVLVDVRQYLNRELQDVIQNSGNLNNYSYQPVPNESSEHFGKVQSAIDNTISELQILKKSLNTKVPTSEFNQHNTGLYFMIEDCNSTIENLKGELQSAESRITNLETQTQETPRKVEIHIPTPQPSPPVQTREVPIEKKPKPMNIFNDHIKENNSRNITYFSSQNEDISSIEKQIRSITETANFFKQSIDIIHNKLKEIDDKNSKTFNQQNLKFNQIQEEIDSLKSKFKRLNEQFIRHHTSDYSKVLNEINNKIDKLEKVTNELSNTPTKTMNRVMYPNIKYVDRVLPPLHTNDEQITKIISNNNNDSNEQFGLLDNSDISTSNTSDNLSETSSSILLSSRSNNTENNELNENENLDLKNDKKKSKKSKNQIKTDVKLKIIRHANNNSRPSTATTSLIITQDEIDQKVDTSITNSLNGFLDRIKIEVQKEIKNGLKTIDTVITKIDQKIDRDFVERMFNKFRVVIGELNEKIEQIQTTFLGWVTRDELQEALQLFAEQMKEVKDTAVGSSKYRCLLCGKPRTHVSGMIINGNSDDDEDEIDKPQNNSAIKNNTKLPSNFKVAKRGDTTVVPRNVVQFLTGK